jgi:hypothetical protein
MQSLKNDEIDALLSHELGTECAGAKHAEFDRNGLWWLSGELCEFQRLSEASVVDSAAEMLCLFAWTFLQFNFSASRNFL